MKLTRRLVSSLPLTVNSLIQPKNVGLNSRRLTSLAYESPDCQQNQSEDCWANNEELDLNNDWDDHFEDTEHAFTNKLRKRAPPKVTVENQFSWIASKVNPFITMPYSEQLRLKFRNHREILIQLGDITKTKRSANKLLPCEYDGVIPSPLIYGYRNKDNFHCGTGVDGNPRTIGQIVGSSSRQEVFTISTEMLISSPTRHKDVLKVLQEFVRAVEIPASFTGHKLFWQDGFIRSNRAGDVALALCLNPKGLPLSDIEREKEKCVEYFSKGVGSRLGLHSLHIKVSPFSCYGREPFELVLGKDHLVEKLIGRDFHISPDAFFQVNAFGAEVLYSAVRKFASTNSRVSSKWTILDACCGTGTIGVLLSDLFENVIGFDIEESAVADARKNAFRNNIANARYYTGSAKSCLKYMRSRGIIDSSSSNKSELERSIVAIVNPSRSGLSNNVMKELRAIPAVKRIVYVSCNPGGRCFNNFEILCRSTRQYSDFFSQKLAEKSDDEKTAPLLGRPFVPTKAVSVDMFPHANHCELVIAFDRD